MRNIIWKVLNLNDQCVARRFHTAEGSLGQRQSMESVKETKDLLLSNKCTMTIHLHSIL